MRGRLVENASAQVAQHANRAVRTIGYDQIRETVCIDVTRSDVSGARTRWVRSGFTKHACTKVDRYAHVVGVGGDGQVGQFVPGQVRRGERDGFEVFEDQRAQGLELPLTEIAQYAHPCSETALS